MTILKSQIKSDDFDFLKNKKQLNIDLNLTLKAVNLSMDGGGEKLKERHESRGKMLPRERVSKLLDPESGFLEVGLTAGYNMYNNDDIISEVREVQEQNYALEEKIDKLTKLVEGLQAQLGNEVDALAKLQMPNFEESMDALEKLTIRKGA